MRDEYDISELNPRRNPYVNQEIKEITIRINADTFNYFKQKAEKTDISYQDLIRVYLTNCAVHKKI